MSRGWPVTYWLRRRKKQQARMLLFSMPTRPSSLVSRGADDWEKKS